MSKAHHDEPLRWHWLYIPLVAFLVFAVGPSVLAPIFFALSLFADRRPGAVGTRSHFDSSLSTSPGPYMLALPVAVWFRSRRIDRRPVRIPTKSPGYNGMMSPGIPE
jgi:hypothetical protein